MTGDWSWVLSPSRVMNFSFSISSRLALGPIQPPQWVPGCEAHHSPPTSALAKKTCIYTSWLHSAQLVMHRENFTLVLLSHSQTNARTVPTYYATATLFHILSDS
jgi:hypothetical protein